jgi:5,10-methenyltetrahydrofolate synthetase
MRSEIRKRALLARELLSEQEVARLSELLVGNLLRTFLDPPGKRVGFCWPIRNEPDVRPAIHAWLKMGVIAALPVAPSQQQALTFRLWQPESPLALDGKGIPAPLNDAPEVVPDALLIPLNAFDARGYRLGYGGGFFDRTLAVMSAPRPLAIGIGFELGRVADVQPKAHDKTMDWLITEKGAWRVRERCYQEP